ncbi:DUF5709 domain-containing protein [Streptomyces sp. NEAU-H3]|uniref:DUF5709 domain-containing protein n=1 Tax=Streptomyces sp. NEAU-H3 TaxID=2720636 RepID=UPI00143BDF5B|nr:DUF5709 domain-containing protein [Streptomyces sp. NEAU-H3]NJA58461.1 hypothetical protein [Streptomyces sp. NEAU-H3]
MDSDDTGRGDDVYQPDGSEERDDDDFAQLDYDDTLLDPDVKDPLDEGYSPVERPLAADRDGTTLAESEEGETLDQRLAEELPDIGDPQGDGLGDALDTDGELRDAEVGEDRSGRLVAPDEGLGPDTEKDMVASDVGIDGAAASAEEAAVHVVEDDENDLPVDEDVNDLP